MREIFFIISVIFTQNSRFAFSQANSATELAPSSEKSFNCPQKSFKVAFQDFGVFYNSQTKTGIDRDFLELLKSRTGCKFIESVLSPSQIWQQMRSGKIDLTLSSINNSNRSKISRFAYYGTSRSVVIHSKTVHAATAFEFSSNQKLKLGIVKGTSYGSKPDIWLKDMALKGRVREFKTEKDLAQALLKKKVSAILTFKFVYESFLSNDLLATHNITIWFPEAESHGVAFSKKTIKDETFRAFEKITAKSITDGEINKIASKFLPPEDVSFYAP